MASAVAADDPAQRTVAVAPTEAARDSFSSERSTATTGVAPTASAPSTALTPTPPQPITATRSPGRTPAVFQTAPIPVETAQPTSAATSNGTLSGIGITHCSGTTTASANVER